MRSAFTLHRKPQTMWLAVTVARMAVSLKNTKTNTPLPIWGGTGGENHQFFCANYLLTSWPRCGIIVVGVERAADGGGVPNFRSHTPYAKFQILLATFHMYPIFPETAGGRSVRHMRQRARDFNRHMALQRYLNRSNISSCEFR